MKKRLFHYTLAALLLLIGLPMAAQRVRAATYTVSTTNDSGPGSLRQAIVDANNNAGPDTIEFNIPKSDPGYSSSDGVWTIAPASPLPSLSGGNTIIDGATQTANQGDTNPAGPEVHIDGQNTGTDGWIFAMTSDWNEILGLVLTRADQCAVQITSGAVGNRVKDSYIGVGPDGQSDAGNGTGVGIVDAEESIIAHNVISWNDLYGIAIVGSGADGNMIRRNTIGLNSLGTAKAPNGKYGVYITGGAKYNIVGGEIPGEEGYRNTISGNTGHGVYISGSGADDNVVSYNYIGFDGAGSGAHGVGNGGSGVAIDGGVWDSHIHYNVVSGNSQHGVLISGGGTNGNSVRGNIIGADAQVTKPVPNGRHGVAIYDGAAANGIGSNVIVGSSWSGVAIVNSDHNFVHANAIGTDGAGTATNLGNNYYGVHVVGGSDNKIGESYIAYNGALPGRAGVRVEGASATGNTIVNLIYDNSGKGIELVDGGNGGRSAPTITQASCQQVQGSTCAGCTVHIFSDEADEGRVYQGKTTAHATTGAFSWSGPVYGPNVTVTATDSQGNTSEFSAPVYAGLCKKVYLPLVLR
jgi:hypothetical protein